MESLGIWLSNARQEKGVSLQQAAETTCIRLRYLEMLEAGNTVALPDGPVQVRGFLTIYARYLGLPVDEALARYDAESCGRTYGLPTGAPSQASSASLAPSPLSYSKNSVGVADDPASIVASLGRPRDLVSRVVLIGALVLVLAGVSTAAYFFIRGASARAAVQAIASAPSAPTVSSIPTESSTEPVRVAPTAIPEVSGAAEDGLVTVVLEATEHVWVRVVQDGQKVFEDFMAQGQMESWSGKESVVVETGNGAGLLVTFNNHLLGTMCGRGEVCTRTWTPGGEAAAD